MSVPVPAENTVKKCDYCDTHIFFARTPKLRDMPLEAKPLRCYTVPPLGPGETKHRCEPLELTVFLPHWGRCPGADEARRRG